MNLKLIGFTKTGHNVVQDSSATQVSSRTPLPTILSTGEAGKIKGECLAALFHFLKINKFIDEHTVKPLGFANAGHDVSHNRVVIQVSSQTPLATIMSTSVAGKIERGCFCSIVSFFENYCKQVHY